MCGGGGWWWGGGIKSWALTPYNGEFVLRSQNTPVPKAMSLKVGLWYKLIRQGIVGKCLIIRSLYDNVNWCVKYKNVVSEYFDCKTGLLQGDVLSPMLFCLCVTYKSYLTIVYTQKYKCKLYFAIIYADDNVFFSETRDGLQLMLNALANYTNNET